MLEDLSKKIKMFYKYMLMNTNDMIDMYIVAESEFFK